MGLIPGGGGGYFHMYAYWVCAARETPIFSPEFLFRSISFSQISPKSVPAEHHHLTFFFGGFCHSGDHHFLKSVPEHHHFTFFGGFCRSGDRHFPAIFRPERQRQTRPGNSGE